MPRFERDEDARRLGEALAALRREAGLSQAEAGQRAGMTSQGWGLYESGKRSGLFRPDVQRRLTGLGFDTKVNGRFDKSTRSVITRWQAARGYPKTGFLNTLQHQALLTESVSAARASVGSGDKSAADGPARRRGGGGVHHRRSGPGGLIGGVVGGLFGRR